MRMPFGKYRGWPLEEVPDGYLAWVLDHCSNAGPTLRTAIRQRLGLEPAPFRAPGGQDWPRVLQTWYHHLALDFHPDRGGSTEAMQAVNEAYDRLLAVLGLPPR